MGLTADEREALLSIKEIYSMRQELQRKAEDALALQQAIRRKETQLKTLKQKLGWEKTA